MKDRRTPFMVAREKFHAARTADTASDYADAALAEKDFGRTPRKPVLAAVSEELRHAGYGADAERVSK